MIASPPAAGAVVPLLAAPSAQPDRRARGVESIELNERYGGRLEVGLRTDRPTIIANFVSTLDGVVSYNTPESAGGGEISGHFEPDRFVMGLLRSLADAVLIGAGTLRAAPDERWTADFIHPPSAGEFSALRATLGLRPNPTTVVVTASGAVDLSHPGLADPEVEAVLVTTDAGAAAVTSSDVPANVDVRAVGEVVRAVDIVELLHARGAELVLCEGGARLFAQMLDASLVDELFLTLAPQLAGRSADVPRLGLVEGVAFAVHDAPWARLADLRLGGDHLFARYRLNGDA